MPIVMEVPWMRGSGLYLSIWNIRLSRNLVKSTRCTKGKDGLSEERTLRAHSGAGLYARMVGRRGRRVDRLGRCKAWTLAQVLNIRGWCIEAGQGKITLKLVYEKKG